jgi:hypothetical protein
MVKKSIISIVILLVLFMASLGIYLIASPEVVIVNRSSQNIDEVIVKLPSSRIVFGSISAKSESCIYYSWSQAEGVYEYQVSFAGGSSQVAQCGNVTDHEMGKRLTLIVHEDLTVTCDESSKI